MLIVMRLNDPRAVGVAAVGAGFPPCAGDNRDCGLEFRSVVVQGLGLDVGVGVGASGCA